MNSNDFVISTESMGKSYGEIHALNTVAILLTLVIVSGVVCYITLGLFSNYGWLSPIGYIASLLAISLHTFYWIALVLMGTLVESSGVAIAVLIMQFSTDGTPSMATNETELPKA